MMTIGVFLFVLCWLPWYTALGFAIVVETLIYVMGGETGTDDT